MNTVFESIETENTLGWKIFNVSNEETLKTISESEQRKIIQLKNKQLYLIKNIPELSLAEAKLLKNILTEYRNKNPKENTIHSNEFLEKFCKEKSITLEKNQKEYLKKILTRLVSPEGILSEILEDEELEEIAILGLGKSKPVFVFDSIFGWLATNLYFSNNAQVRNIINSIAATIGRRITLQKPKLNAVLKDGSRLNACIEPASISGPAITIRKFKKNPFTPLDLVKLGSVSLKQIAFLWMAIQSDCSVFVCGNTGSGKTTLLNSLLSFVPKNERIIIIEETPELNPPHFHFVKLATAEDLEINMQDLIVNTLRMRPDRVIVGEIRSKEETKAFIDTLLAGQGKGTYGTFHAQSGNECIARLQNLGANEMDLLALDLILTQKRWSTNSGRITTEERKLIEISEPVIEKNKIKAKKIFSYNYKKNRVESENKTTKIYEKISITFGLNKNGIKKELKKREEFLAELNGKTQEEFFYEINNYGKIQ